MKLLFYQWHSFMNKGVERALKQLDIEYDVLFFQQTDWEKDTGLKKMLEQKLEKQSYAAVFSVNFAPIVSEVCEEKQIPYISWVYDAPIHIRNIESLKNDVNQIFFFDRVQAEGYQKLGIHAYHMPLAADIDTFSQAKWSREYETDISLVGKLYRTEYNYYCSPLPRYLTGYLDGILQAQSKLYGGYLLTDLLDEKLLEQMNEQYQKASKGTAGITKAELEFMMACEITGRERYLALALLANHYRVDLYSTDEDERLQKVCQRGYADYYEQMPQIFKSSKINLNISLKIIQSGIPLRVFDVLGCGGFLLTNFQAEMPEYFTMGEDFVVYENMEDLFAKADFYLRHDTERKRIAEHGFETVKQNYTFEKQLQKILMQAEGIRV
ncbi:MAG: glycosyltransferase [Roseburia sp.]